MSTTKRQKLVDALNDLRQQYHAAIVNAVRECPHKSYLVIAEEYGVSESLVMQLVKLAGVMRTKKESSNG